MTIPPRLDAPKNEPLQDYYTDREGKRYEVARMLDAAKDLPVFDTPLASLDLSGCLAWSDCSLVEAAHHLQRVRDADLSFPILLDWNGTIADGRHRIVKAIIEGQRTIKTRRLMQRMEPSGHE